MRYERTSGFPVNGEAEELTVMPSEDRLRIKDPEDAEAYADDTSDQPQQELEPEDPDKWRNLISFWILGLCNNYGYVVMLSAAHDILASKSDSDSTTSSTATPTQRDCNLLSTGAILLADIIPALLTKLVIPFCPLYVHFRMVLMLVLACAGFILTGASEVQWVAIAGVVCTSFSSGIGEATLLSYMPFFKNKNVISTWSSGTGGAGILGSFSYAFFIAIGLTAETTLYLMLVVPALMAFTFWVLLKRPRVQESSVESTPSPSSSDLPTTFTTETFGQKLRHIPSLFKYMIPLGLVYLFEYFINQGLFELVYFDGTFINHAEQYRWYQVLYQVGVFISRSSINVVQIKYIWLLAVLQGLNAVLFTTQAIYFYIPNIYIVIVLVLWEGLLGGAAYVNTFYKINKEVAPEKREFSMAMTTVADSFGITIAGFLSIPAHNYICGLPVKV